MHPDDLPVNKARLHAVSGNAHAEVRVRRYLVADLDGVVIRPVEQLTRTGGYRQPVERQRPHGAPLLRGRKRRDDIPDMIETAELYKLTGARQRCAALPLAHCLRPHREARLCDVFCHLRLVVSRGAPRRRQTRAEAVVVHGRSPSCGSEIFYLQYIGYCQKTQAFFSYKAKNRRLISLIKRIIIQLIACKEIFSVWTR